MPIEQALFTIETYIPKVGWYPILVDAEGNIVYFDESEAHLKLRETEQTFTDLGEHIPTLRVKARSIN